MPPADEEPPLCTTTEIAWYERTCTYYSDGVVFCTEWEYVYSDYTTYCTGGSGGGGGGSGGDSGYIEYDEPSQQPDPCSAAKPGADTATNFSKNSNYQTSLNAIKNASADGNEHAISFGKDANGNILMSQMSTGDDHSGEVGRVTNQFADLHNHPDDSPFDSGDLYGFIDHAVENNAYTRYVVTTDGSVYALVLTDLQAAKDFNTNYPRVLHPDPSKNYEPAFPEAIVNKINEIKGFYQATDEMALSFILQKYNSGVAILKQNQDGSFKKLDTKETVDSNGTLHYTPNNCL